MLPVLTYSIVWSVRRLEYSIALMITTQPYFEVIGLLLLEETVQHKSS